MVKQKLLLSLVLSLLVLSSFASSSHLGENEDCGFWCQYFGNGKNVAGKAV